MTRFITFATRYQTLDLLKNTKKQEIRIHGIARPIVVFSRKNGNVVLVFVYRSNEKTWIVHSPGGRVYITAQTTKKVLSGNIPLPPDSKDWQQPNKEQLDGILNSN